MKKQIRDYVIAKTQELIAAPTCSTEARSAAQRWLTAAGTPEEDEETRKYIAELEEDIMPIDSLIAFASSEQGTAYFGEDTAAGIVEHSEEIKAAGAKFCDCPACLATAEILAHKAQMLK